jgi:tellurite resistance protein TerA
VRSIDLTGFRILEKTMRLKQKGEETSISLKNLTVKMTWTAAADFDLAALYKTKNDVAGLIYFGDLGDLKNFPFMALNKDEGVGDSAGNKEEVLTIAKLDEMKFVWLLCWDYNRVKIGEMARFADSDVVLSFTDQSGQSNLVNIDTQESGNVCCLAVIDNSSSIGAMLINASRPATLQGLKTLEQLLALVE